ncbi:hypothetical protein Clacol_001058 [Clathrus columnatus]|uniref:Xylanolytic transcriptional activator regulatory domain-containing protein n=1 Tax=Clathrus columnatus TaxID=1419009 RepID=A0AAV5A003_9AGAM|nr:hypothetical protein Clacol_001058 [Clathrus columnatus]
MFEEDLGLNIILPREQIQDNLLSLYWKYVQPILPVIDKGRFLKDLIAERQNPGTSRKIPRLLLLSMFTVSARYAHYDPLPTTKGTMWEAGCDYLDQAKHILNWTYDSPRTSTCQALTLLAYRAISQAWMYMGMAIRMATELGIHRSADRWQLGGRVLFSEAEISLRKQYLVMLFSIVTGRPMCIRERDYEIALPDLEENEELELWSPRGIEDSYYKLPCYTISTLHATSSLSSILALVVDTIYACRSGHLKYSDKDEFVPLPHILTLNMTFWCVMLLAHRPFIRHHTSSDSSDEELDRMSEKSLSESQNAASRISNLVAIHRHSWDLSCANPYLGWIMHVATLAMNLNNQHEARMGLQHCLDALEDMKIVWPSSERALQLLRGTEVDNNVVQGLPNTPNVDGRSDTSGTSTIPYLTPHQAQSSTWTSAPAQTDSSEYPNYASFIASMNCNSSFTPTELSYFPGYEHWPPEFLVFQSHHSHSPYNDYNN